MRIGPDLAVTGFDGSLIASMLAPALTTIGMPLADIAARLVDRVIGQVAGIPGGQGEILGPVLVRGRSA